MLSTAKSRDWRRPAGWLLGIGLLIVGVYFGVRSVLVNAHGPVRLVVYAFSTQEEALTQGIFPAFEQMWEAETGKELTIEGVFGPSATLAGQVNLGSPADIALFSNAQHVRWLQIGRQVRRDTQPAVIGHTPLVIVTRPGLNESLAVEISGYADLANPGLQLIHADPRSSGAGEWAVLAEYGSAWLEAGDRVAAEEQLRAIWCNVRLLSPSARATLTLFELGAGDTLVTYEQDARLALERGVALEIVTPPRTILAQPVVVIVDENVTRAERPAAEAFIDYLLGDDGQRILSRYYLRPAGREDDRFPVLADPFTVKDLGGWSSAYHELVEGVWQTEIEPRLELEAGPILLRRGDE